MVMPARVATHGTVSWLLSTEPSRIPPTLRWYRRPSVDSGSGNCRGLVAAHPVTALESSMSKFSVRVALSIALTLGSALVCAHAKPIAFADGTTVMAEYGAGTMTEVQAFYAPTFRYSVGGGHLSLNSSENDDTRDITYSAPELPAEALEYRSRAGQRLRLGQRRTRAHRRDRRQPVRMERRRPARLRDSPRLRLAAHRSSRSQLPTVIASTRCSSASLPTSTTTRRSRCGSSCRRVTTPAASSTAPNGRRCFGSSRRNAWLEAGVTLDGQAPGHAHVQFLIG